MYIVLVCICIFFLYGNWVAGFSDVSKSDPTNEYRALWVDTWHHGIFDHSEVETLYNRCCQYNYNALFVEVRKVGDAFHCSDLEPKANEIDPSYDPLADLISLCHETSGGKPYIEVHAWLVAYRISLTSSNPAAHILSLHPEWIMQDINGNTSYGSSRYLDPGVPGVLQHNLNVALEIANKYDVDGIHYDYIRYPGQAWGYNPISVQRFNTIYNRTGTPARDDPDWMQFRRDQVTALVRQTYVHLRDKHPRMKLSAATIPWGTYTGDFTQSSAYRSVFQDWAGWMQEGILDINCPMIYRNPSNQSSFQGWVDFAASVKCGRHCVIGIGAYMNPVSNTIYQINLVRANTDTDGVVLFSYATTNNEGLTQDTAFQMLKDNVFQQPATIPVATWLTNPSDGIIAGYVTVNGEPADGAIVSIGEPVIRSIRADGNGFYAFLKLAPQNYSISVSYPGYPVQSKTAYASQGKVNWTNFEIASY